MIDLKIIKRLCYERGITLRILSEKTKISQTALTMSINRNSTTLETLEKIARFFGISVGEFFGERDIFNPIRKSFEEFDKDVKKACNYVVTTLLYYAPELSNPTPLEALSKVADKMPPEVMKIIEFTTSKVAENPVFAYLMKFSYDEILQMKRDGILSKDTVDLILAQQNSDFFVNHKVIVDIEGKGDPNFWEKLKNVISEYNRKNNPQPSAPHTLNASSDTSSV